MPKARFNSVFAALNYYAQCNPARAKSVNIFEPDPKSTNCAEQFSGDHPADVWAKICLTVRDALIAVNDARVEKALKAHYLCDSEEAPSKDEIAKALGISTRMLYYLLEAFFEDFENRLEIRGILPRSKTMDEFDA